MSTEEEPSITDIPVSLKPLVGSYIQRAQELSNVQPLISYFCYLYAAQLIMESQLHLTDSNATIYIEVLLNTIEDERTEFQEKMPQFMDVLSDKEKSFKLILGFSLNIFKNAVNAVETHTVTKETAVSFKAFLTFIEVVKLWPDFYATESNEIHKHIKYAKFHATRILKALKNGTDINDYATADELKELEELEGSENTNEEISDEINEEVSKEETNDSAVKLPTPPNDIKGELKMPSTPVLIKGRKNSLGLPTAPESDIKPESPKLPEKPKSTVQTTIAAPVIVPSKPQVQSNPTSSKILTKEEVQTIWNKEEIISNAQRKAKFAISALNYEDIETAIKELQAALSLLRGE
ncbi:Vta1 protein [Pichia kluyveri]|uniref:Vta1 protein n=1 Tax=Pichia kluyveri TaxID=36015 RepID=A0AAV5R4S2_PICKL|nr:Vta1 protein [Pichia kluyveri]